MSPSRKLWRKGDFSKLAATMRGSIAALVERLRITPGMKVPDRAFGPQPGGRCASAGRGRGGWRTAAVEGDGRDLSDLPDDGFDLMVSILGAMFAPCPVEVARGRVRVMRPGGRIVMGNSAPPIHDGRADA